MPAAADSVASAVGGGELRAGGLMGRRADAAPPPYPKDELEALATECGITLAQARRAPRPDPPPPRDLAELCLDLPLTSPGARAGV